MPKLIENPIGMSREDFDKLPPVIPRKVFILATGLTRNEVDEMGRAGDIKRLPVGRTKTKNRYYKADAARIAGYIKVELKHG